MEGYRVSKIAILGVVFVVLVVMVIGFFVMMNGYNSYKPESTQHDDDIKDSIRAVCMTTDYNQTCVESLTESGTESTDPYDHVKTMFEITIQKLDAAVNNSSLLKEVHEDPRTDDALIVCKELFGLAIRDLRRSFEKLNGFGQIEIGQALDELKIWMSGAITYEQTCLDGFENTEGDSGEKMRKVLNVSMELTSIGLAMITDLSQALEAFDAPQSTNRRLLSLFNNDHNLPGWVDDRDRNIFLKPIVEIDPNVTVAQDGSGDFVSINEALKVIPHKGEKRFVVYIKQGVYKEIVQIPKHLTRVMVIGDGPEKTRITGSLNYMDGITTFHTATFAVCGDFFMAKDIAFENTAGPEKHQAVALRVSADRAILYNCHMDGYQDTLYAHTYRQFYRECIISGTIDFVFGDSAAVFQNCILVVRKPMNNQNCIVTAQGRKEIRQPTGTVLQNCSIVADPIYYPARFELKSYLGRPWKQFSRTIIMESFIDDLIQPQGWLPWNETFAFDTLFYTEFNNHGPGSSKLQRIPWPGVKELTTKEIKSFTPGKFITGDAWIPPTGVPYASEFFFEPPKDHSKDDHHNKQNSEDNDDASSPKKEKKRKKDKKPKKHKKPKKDKGSESTPDSIPSDVMTKPPAASPIVIPDVTTKPPAASPIIIPDVMMKPPAVDPIIIPVVTTKPPAAGPIIIPGITTRPPATGPIMIPDVTTKPPAEAPIIIPDVTTKPPAAGPTIIPDVTTKPPAAGPTIIPDVTTKPPAAGPIIIPDATTKPPAARPIIIPNHVPVPVPVPASEISAPASSPTHSPEATSPETKNRSFFKNIFGTFSKG